MKKLNLKSSGFQNGEVLTRSQLKKVLGGTGSGGPDACAGKSSVIKCRDNSGNDLGTVNGTGCLGSYVTTSCNAYPTFDIAHSQCNC
ncbi:hypothetical protein GFS24_17820 [Chitinophaga sp. SYP-B3965]|uniref:hypothetical protein n=1 Tax=Chitinophaga sp. SYP-B3965 TaxID=2663120 RepID=UPI001299A289|nr:hypothetical protein [Chitinophaga sp. SYP-B3965]MRG46985.1 hypothetical protein [Chitinophaga sp. SYP-B3965]